MEVRRSDEVSSVLSGELSDIVRTAFVMAFLYEGARISAQPSPIAGDVAVTVWIARVFPKNRSLLFQRYNDDWRMLGSDPWNWERLYRLLCTSSRSRPNVRPQRCRRCDPLVIVFLRRSVRVKLGRAGSLGVQISSRPSLKGVRQQIRPVLGASLNHVCSMLRK